MLLQIIYISGSVQDYNNSSALAMELLQSCTNPSVCSLYFHIVLANIWKTYFGKSYMFGVRIMIIAMDILLLYHVCDIAGLHVIISI